jgi:ribosome maturation factor RimP
MALQLDQIRALADRVAASHHLELVDLEFSGGAKHRTLRVFIEKDAASRARLIQLAAQANSGAASEGSELNPPDLPELPKGVPVEKLSGVTHEDCVAFTNDFGTVLDVEDLVPGTEYTLEVSSPGLERKLSRPADFQRFTGSLIKLQTFTAIAQNRRFEGRLTAFTGDTLTLDLSAVKPKGKARKNAATAQTNELQVPLANVEKANLIPEI